jgi:SAM-dependent methyltransferase
MKSATEFYNEIYFKRYLGQPSILGPANLFKFSDFITPQSNVLDFGCGPGLLLHTIDAADKIGIEINPIARDFAKSIGIEKVYPDTSNVADGWADVIISNHAMEHVEDPIPKFREFYRILKPAGKAIVVTPYDSVSKQFHEDDRDFHLFSWNPATIGNLAKACGFKVIDSAEIVHRWPPKAEQIWITLGPSVFHLACRIYGHLRRSGTQVRVIAQKPD